jgi:hypothetical protein
VDDLNPLWFRRSELSRRDHLLHLSASPPKSAGKLGVYISVPSLRRLGSERPVIPFGIQIFPVERYRCRTPTQRRRQTPSPKAAGHPRPARTRASGTEPLAPTCSTGLGRTESPASKALRSGPRNTGPIRLAGRALTRA